MNHARVVLVGLLLVTGVAIPAGPGHAQVVVLRSQSIDDLRGRIVAAIGAGAVSCGEHDNGNVVKGTPVTREILQGFLDCLTDARRRGAAAWAFQSGSGFDSWVADGLMIAADGTATHFHYDSLGCVRGDCALTTTDCPLPRVATDPGWVHFECVPPMGRRR